MRGTAYKGTTDWVQFHAPDKNGVDTEWNVNLTFLLSGYQCIYGQGCPGHFGITDRFIAPDVACCSDGFYVRDENDHANIEDRIKQLTDADWDIKNRKYVEKHGWKIARGEDNIKSRVMDGGCVFANRTDGSAGKPGCAFVALANRMGEEVDDSTVEGHASHTNYMPAICHEVPLRFEWVDGYDPEDPLSYNVCHIDAWDASKWTSQEGPGQEQDDWMCWWCVDSPEAYINETALMVRMKDTIISLTGQTFYDELVKVVERKQPKVDPMHGATLNDGRPLLPLIIGGRVPKRPDENFEQHYKKMEAQQ